MFSFVVSLSLSLWLYCCEIKMNTVYTDLHALDGADESGFALQLLLDPDRTMIARQQRRLGCTSNDVAIRLTTA